MYYQPYLFSDDDEFFNPICWPMICPNGGCNVKFLQFVLLFMELGIRFGQFEEEERAGLLATQYFDGRNCNALQYITKCTAVDGSGEEQRQLVDESCLSVLNRLKEMNQSFSKRRHSRTGSDWALVLH